MDRIYRGNRDIAVETYMPIKQGLYRGIKHSNEIENSLLTRVSNRVPRIIIKST